MLIDKSSGALRNAAVRSSLVENAWPIQAYATD